MPRKKKLRDKAIGHYCKKYIPKVWSAQVPDKNGNCPECGKKLVEENDNGKLAK